MISQQNEQVVDSLLEKKKNLKVVQRTISVGDVIDEEVKGVDAKNKHDSNASNSCTLSHADTFHFVKEKVNGNEKNTLLKTLDVD